MVSRSRLTSERSCLNSTASSQFFCGGLRGELNFLNIKDCSVVSNCRAFGGRVKRGKSQDSTFGSVMSSLGLGFGAALS